MVPEIMIRDHGLMVPDNASRIMNSWSRAEIMIRDHGLMVPEQMANLANHFFPWRARAFWNQPFSSFGLACREPAYQ
jgi:hypothetical protein